MRKFIPFLFLASSVFAQSHEILRPTIDSNSNITSLFCSGINQAAGTMPNAHDASGLSTFSTITATGTYSATVYKVRQFTTWPSTTQSYTALTLNVNSYANETNNNAGSGVMEVAYSTNGGINWFAVIYSSGTGWSQRTSTINLSASQDFTQLRVAICVQGTSGSPQGSIDTINAYDIWTDGTYSSGGGGGGAPGSSQGAPAIQPVFISAVDRRREYASYNC